MIVVRVKVSRAIVPFFPMGIDSADRPMGRFAWTNHIYPARHMPAVVPLHLCTNRGGPVPIEAALYK